MLKKFLGKGTSNICLLPSHPNSSSKRADSDERKNYKKH